MINNVVSTVKPKALWALRVLLVLSLLIVPQLLFPHKALAATSASDDFNRADGGLGANWTAIADGGMAIASQQVTGTAGVLTGDTWTASTFTSDQYSVVQVTSTQLTGTQWIGAAVRAQNGGHSAYVGIYSWNSGSPVLQLFKRTATSSWTQLGSTYSSGPLAAGTQLEVAAVGSTISFWQNGVKRISVTDKSFTGGAPGIMINGSGTADNWSGGNAASFTVGGAVSGLSGTVVLQDNGGDNLSVSANGSFTFATALPSGAPYSVTVKTNPSGQTCAVSNGSGTIGSANVTSVGVTCSNVATYTVGGTVSGLSGTVVLQDNGGDNLSVSANGSFTFATALASGAAYAVTVKTNPSGQTCTVSNGSGTVGSANVTSVAVTCSNVATYTVGGTVSGLSGTVVLQDNGGDNLSVSANGSFTFATALASGAAYAVTVKTNPSGQTCTVSNGSGTVGSANVTSVAVTCAASPTSASDDFNRADGGLGANWTAIADGGMAIASQQVTGTAGVLTGDTWTASTFTSDQYSVVQVTSTQLTGTQWIGAAVRAQNGGHSAYVGIYSWNSGSPVLQLFKRTATSSWTQLGSTYSSGPLAAGTQLEVAAVGSTISFWQNGVKRISVTDKSFTGGAPGIMINGSGTADNWSGGNAASFTVGGAVSGLSGTVVLQDNGGDNLSVSANGSFTFATALPSGAPYSVTVKTNPSGQTCAVSNGSGTIGSANVTNVGVSCTTSTGGSFTVGGAVSGLSGTVVLQDNGGDDLSVSANGSFTFATALASGAAYSVTVKTNPSGQTCTVSNGSGTIGSANVTNVGVSCTTSTGGSFTVGGAVSGLSGTVVLQDNGGDDLSVSANGSFTFATALASGAAYSVTAKTNPSGQTCTVSNGSGTIGSANVTNVGVSCTTSTGGSFTVGGAVSGLSGTVVLQDNGGDDLSVSANGSFTFATALASGAAYSVTAKTNPSGQTCTVSNGTGTIGSANVTNVGVSCSNTASFTVGGAVSGLSGTVVLQDNGGDDLSVSVNGSFTFGTALASGAAYSVTAKTNPSGQTCTVSNGTGTIGSANVTNVGVSCTANTATSASDDFNRADGGLGANWTAIADGGMAIASQQVTGTAGVLTGDLWTAGSFGSDQYSQVQVTSTPLTGGQWVGAAVRAQNGGHSAYVGIYYWNSGSPVLQLFKRTGTSSWTQLGSTYSSGPLAAGTQLEVAAVGSTISFWQNGVKRISVTDSTFTGGAPGMMAFGNSTADNWSGGNAASFTVGGAVSGLSGTVVLQDNGGDNLSVSANGSFTFATALPSGAPYSVTVKTNPSGQTCAVSNGSGTIGSANVTNVGVSCTTSTGGSFTVGGAVSGLSGTVVLQDNGGDDLSVSANGSFTFATALASGAAYSVTVKTNPSGQTCTVSNGSGTIGSANVTNVGVSCTTSTGGSFTVGGAVSGLSGTVVLQDNGGDDLSVSANGSFTFATALASGAAYSVTAKTNPSGQTCTVSNGTGTIGSANVTNVGVSCTANTATSASDDFNRADGGLGANWTAIADGGMAIASQQVTGTAGVVSGDIRTAETYPGDQYSEVEVTSTQLTGSQWIGPAVRLQNGGQDGYVGIYNWNSGSPVLQLFKRSGGNWTQLGSTYSSGPLAAGTKLRLTVLGNSISFTANGVERIGLTDSTFSSGAPGIMAFGSATADNWSGSSVSFQVNYQSTDAQGVKSYEVLSADDGYGPQTLRVLAPTNPAPGTAHNFLIVLPVQSGQQNTFGDGLATIEALDEQDQYNLTIIEPTFAIDPWYADNPNDPNLHYESFMTQELVPWIKQHLSTTGNEQTWLIGFSKSGIGGQDLILKHPDLFTLAASWDLPANMSSYNQFGSNSASNYGTDANFQANYRLTTDFVDVHKGQFLVNKRIWIGGYNLYSTDDSDYNNLLTSEAIVHSYVSQQYPAHSWDSGWVPTAMAVLYQDSINLH